MEAKASAGEARGLGEENARDLLEFTPVHMDWAEDRHFAEIFSLFGFSKNFLKKQSSNLKSHSK